MNPKVISIRFIRKASHILNRGFNRGEKFTYKVEDKATRILTGRDFSGSLFREVPFEKAFYGGIPYNIVPLNPALPALGRKGKVTLLIPSLSKSSFYGGTATALITAAKLSQLLDKQLRIIETLKPGGKEGIEQFFKDYGIRIKDSDIELIDVSARKYNLYGYIDLHEDDVLIASAWWDAHIIDKLPLNKPYIYLIQDYEPIFYANSDKYLLAENTYRSNKFIPLCNTRLMYDFMASKYTHIKKSGLWFEPAVSQISKGVSIQNQARRRIFLYGRPMVERNLFYSGLYALNEVFSNGKLDVSDWEIFMAGQDSLPDITLSTGIKVRNLGKMPIGEYREFARTVDLTISLMMAPHPNYPTLELASIGSAVVTTRYENKNDLKRYSPLIFMANLTIDSLVENITRASSMSYEERLELIKDNDIGDDWAAALAQPLDEVRKKLKRNESSKS
jgi:hypothetical protein